MPWTERQQAVLRAMGLRVWQPAGGQTAAAPALMDGGAVPQPQPQQQPTTLATPAAAAPTVPITVVRPAVPPGASLPPGLVRDATAAPALALDWPALRATVAACTLCTLCESRTQTVFGVGHPRAGWMVVGEAPGEQEDRRGEPFVGPSGQLLDAMLQALNVTRADVGGAPERRAYIANTLKCRPPGNRNPTPVEIARCEPYLVRQIDLVQPRIILAMGKFAAQALLGSNEPVGRLRGRVHRYHGVPLVVTYHPAYLLRNLHDKARAWEDLCLAAATAEAEATPR